MNTETYTNPPDYPNVQQKIHVDHWIKKSRQHNDYYFCYYYSMYVYFLYITANSSNNYLRELLLTGKEIRLGDIK